MKIARSPRLGTVITFDKRMAEVAARLGHAYSRRNDAGSRVLVPAGQRHC